MAATSLAASAGAGPIENAIAAPAVLDSPHGNLRGIHGSDVDAYLGIPFAEPPLGVLRWRPPVRSKPWRGARDAAHFAANCYQAPAQPFGPWTAEFLYTGPISEDCLYLNVWTPARRASRLPVLVWIHGGGFGSGSGSIPIYNGASLASHGVVVVTLNYRLGAFGFLAHPELSRESKHGVSGNYGLLDVIAALEWVRDDIAAFGGDPANVTLAGQSAGAIAVNDLMFSPLAKGLFSRAIAESGSGMGVKAEPLREAEAHGLLFAQSAGAASLAALRAIPAERLLSLAKTSPPPPGEKLQSVPPPPFEPTLDHHVLLADPEVPGGRPVSPLPLLTGFNADEADAFGSPVLTPGEFEAQVQGRYGNAAPSFLGAYPHATPEDASRSAELIARDRYMASLLIWTRARTAATGAKTYAYLFEHPLPGPRSAQFRTFHTAEVPYVFGVLDQGGRPFGANDRAICDQVMAYWLRFLRSGDPNGGGQIHWPPSTAEESTVMGLGDHPGPRPAVSTPERFAIFATYAAGGGYLSLF
jgi:para-nitrobenzyl esterase